jgi:tRNA(fMet)-specific endonuclease VapC
MRYLVDTDSIIDGLAGISSILDWFNEHLDEGLAVSIVTLAEVYEGAYINPDPEVHIASFQAFLAIFTILPLIDQIAQRFARLRATLRRQGNLIPDLDLLIAATAIEHDLTLRTRNRRQFERIRELRLG